MKNFKINKKASTLIDTRTGKEWFFEGTYGINECMKSINWARNHGTLEEILEECKRRAEASWTFNPTMVITCEYMIENNL